MIRPDLHSLLERVRNAEKGSRVLDALIAVWAINHQPRSFAELQDGLPDGTYYYESGDEGEEPEQFGLAVAARYSTSLDAIVSLIEKELPGRWPEIMSDAKAAMWARHLSMPVEKYPLFCLQSLLSAKLSTENTDAEA